MRRFLIALILLPLLAACSGDPAKVKVSEKVHDKKAYALGEQHAREAIALSGDEAALQDKLLDVRARISNISSKLGPQSAHDYEAGFTDRIRHDSDSLAKILF